MRRMACLTICLVAVAASRSGFCDQAGSDETGPLKSGLVEKLTKRVVQLDVSLISPTGSVPRITADDLEVRVGRTTLRDFTVDRLSATPSDSASAAGSDASGSSILLFFDEHHLTSAGRAHAIEVGRDLVRGLVTARRRGAIVSSGTNLVQLSPWSGDSGVLLAALDRLEADTSLQDSYAQGEKGRVSDLESEVRQGRERAKGQRNSLEHSRSWNIEEYTDATCPLPRGPSRKPLEDGFGAVGEQKGMQAEAALGFRAAWLDATAKATALQREEAERARLTFDRLRLALLRLSSAGAPRALVYFGDLLRLNAGDHYMRSLEDGVLASGGVAAAGLELGRSSGSRDVQPYFDDAVTTAGIFGARIYTVQAESMVSDNEGLRDAKDTLASLATATGGLAFLEGFDESAIAGTVREDLAQSYVVSFDPSGLPEDRPLDVRIEVHIPDVVVRAPSRVVIQSESARLESRRLAALLSPRGEGRRLGVGLVPVGFDGKRYTCLLQVLVPDGGPAGTVWDVRASIVVDGRLSSRVEKKVTGRRTGEPIVLEQKVEIAPGTSSVIATAQDLDSDALWSGQSAGIWPRPAGRKVVFSPWIALQPGFAQFVRDDETRTSGSLAIGGDEPMRRDLPAALVGLVCGPSRGMRPLEIRRRLDGNRAVAFDPIELPAMRDRCIQVRDVIRANTLGDGRFRYGVEVVGDGLESVAQANKDFIVGGFVDATVSRLGVSP